MKKDIIDTMSAELSGTQLCKNDFQYDLKSLENYDGPFFWMVRKNGTSLQKIGFPEMLRWGETQGVRFQLFRDSTWPIASIMYWKEEGSKYFYYDGLSLRRIQAAYIPIIWRSLSSDFREHLIETYREEYDMKDKKLEIIPYSEETKILLDEQLAFAKEIGDESLSKCLEDLSNHWRSSTDHVIQIYRDFEEHSFGWSEVVNGNCVLNGGIVYHSYLNSNRWQIHT